MNSALRLYVRPRRPRNPARVARPLDITAASLTPDQRSMMLALVEQDRALRRRSVAWLTVAAVGFVAWLALTNVIVAGVVLGWWQP